MVEETLHVSGMSCGGCEETVEDALEGIDGVERATAEHETDTVLVERATDVPAESLADVVDEAGYVLVD